MRAIGTFLRLAAGAAFFACLIYAILAMPGVVWGPDNDAASSAGQESRR